MKMKSKNLAVKNPALVLGMFETGLAVGRSLGRKGITVYGCDKHKDIGFYSRYINASICPDPRNNELFLDWLRKKILSFDEKPVLYFTSDDFLLNFSGYRDEFKDIALFNLPPQSLLDQITDKYKQYKLAINAGINVPKTLLIEEGIPKEDITTLQYPVFVKGLDVTRWRAVFGGVKKGFLVHNEQEFEEILKALKENKIDGIVQELIYGTDDKHYKYCVYINEQGKVLNSFGLQKIRQNPIRFGVGSVVVSVVNSELKEVGEKLFKNIEYRGVGSAEFKKDERDGKWKLIEVNPRYWQQNGLTEFCGNNFAFSNYLDLTGQSVEAIEKYDIGKKWINIYMDIDSFMDYRKEKLITLSQWLSSIKGPKMFSDMAFDDIIPGFYEIRFGKKLFDIPKYFLRKLIK